MPLNLVHLRDVTAAAQQRYQVEQTLFGRWAITDREDGGRQVITRLPDRCTAEVIASLLNTFNDDLGFLRDLLANQGVHVDVAPAAAAGRG